MCLNQLFEDELIQLAKRANEPLPQQLLIISTWQQKQQVLAYTYRFRYRVSFMDDNVYISEVFVVINAQTLVLRAERAAWIASMDSAVRPIIAVCFRSRANRFTALTWEAGAKDKGSINTAGAADEQRLISSSMCSCLCRYMWFFVMHISN